MPSIEDILPTTREWALFFDARKLFQSILDLLVDQYKALDNRPPATENAHMSAKLFQIDLRQAKVVIERAKIVSEERLEDLTNRLPNILECFNALAAGYIQFDEETPNLIDDSPFSSLKAAVALGFENIQSKHGGVSYYNWLKGSECLEEFNAIGSKVFSNGIIADHEHVFSVLVKPNVQVQDGEDLTRGGSHELINHLRRDKCHSKSRHLIRIQGFRDYKNENARLQHRMFLSRCKSSKEWGEIIFRDQAHSLHCSGEPPDAISSLCCAMEEYMKDEAKLSISVNNQTFVDVTQWSRDQADDPPVWPIVPLNACLNASLGHASFFLRDKYLLIINIARSLLWLHDAGLPVQSWQAGNLFFSCNSVKPRRIRQKHSPFVSFELHDMGKDHNNTQDESRQVLILVLLAKLIIEVWTWRNISPPPGKRVQVIVGKAFDEGMSKWTNALSDGIRLCLDAKKQKDANKTTALVKDRLIRIVSRLEKEVSEFFPEISEADERKTEDADYDGEIEDEDEIIKQEDKDHDKEERTDKSEVHYEGNKTTWAYGTALGFLQRGFSSIQANALFQPYNNLRPKPTCLPKITTGVLHFGDHSISNEPTRSRLHDSARNFLNDIHKWHDRHIQGLDVDKKVKVAILDTGVNTHDERIPKALTKRSRCKSFVDDDIKDSNGHGTHVASLFIRVAPTADVFIAKIANSNDFDPEFVVDAIKWAVGKGVNIVIMSWGLKGGHPNIEAAMDFAASEGVIFFAAAANCGGRGPRTFPANTSKVIAIHASDGDGNSWEGNPTHLKYSYNFSTLGTGVPSGVQETSYLSGTSFATPIAAGFAANVFTYVNFLSQQTHLPTARLSEDEARAAFKLDGMQRILYQMSENRDEGYHFVFPCRNWWTERHEAATVDEETTRISTRIRDALEGLY